MQTHEVAVVARDPVALRYFGGVGSDLANALELARRGPDPDDRRDGEAERTRIELGAIARDHASSLEPAHALGDGGGGHPDAATELGEADAAVPLELCEETKVDRVEKICFVGVRVSQPCCMSHRRLQVRRSSIP